MAKQGADRPRSSDQRRPQVNPQTERTTPRSYLREVQGEMKRVAWPIHNAVIENSIIVVVGVVAVAGLIAGLDIGLSKLATALF